MAKSVSVPRLKGRAGTSLIEVLITLVIFLTGMAYMLRMFPGGFVSLKHDENVTLANRMAQAELERIQGRAVNLPSAILPWGWDTYTGTYNILPVMDPEDLGDQLDPTGALPPAPYDTPAKVAHYLSGVNKFRYIAGERTRIPAPTGVNWSNGCVYVLQFSPILDPVTTGAPFVVYGGAMQRRWLSAGANVASKLTGDGDYMIDYQNGLLHLKTFTGPARDYVITYSYWVDIGGVMELRPVVAMPVHVDPTVERDEGGYYNIELEAPVTGGGTTQVATIAGFGGIDRASDTLARRFVPVTAWSANPYEFMLIDSRSGVIAFNPRGYGYTEYTARGRQPLTANMDYVVLDWHILREERSIPEVVDNPTDLDAKLTLRFIKESFQSPELHGATYQGLAPDFGMGTNSTVNFDVLAVDVETGQSYTPSSVIPGTGNPVMKVDYKEGVIRFDPVYAEAVAAAMGIPNPPPMLPSPFAGKTFRIYYRAEGDWGLQTYKAHELYQRSYDERSVDQRQYFLDANGVIYFQQCSAGSTVAVDFAYRVNGGPEIYSSGQMYQVDKRAGVYGYAVNLTGKLQGVYGPAAVINVTKINKVYGVSLGVRAAWRESGRGFSAGQWRKVDLQTYLTRPAEN